MTDIDKLIAEWRSHDLHTDDMNGQVARDFADRLTDALEAERQRNAELTKRLATEEEINNGLGEQVEEYAAVIEKARTQATRATEDEVARAYLPGDIHRILATADPAAVLREVKAEAWGEGRTFAARGAASIPSSVVNAPNPYRGGA